MTPATAAGSLEAETWSDEGVECPACNHVMHPDDPCFYDEGGLELECSDCGVSLDISPYCSWSWTTKIKIVEMKDAE